MKIKKCPFCGSDDLHVQGNKSTYVYCENCDTYGPDGEDEEEAIRLWNHAPRVGDNDCDYPNLTGGCHIFPKKSEEEPKMEKCCQNCVHISKEVDGKVYCTEEVDADYSCKYWEQKNSFLNLYNRRLCMNCKHSYTDGEYVTYCGREIGNPKRYVCDKWELKASVSTPLNPSNSSSLDVIGEIVTRTLFPSNVRQLIEEAAELIVACNKYIRATGNGQPTPVSEDEALAMIAEELADVHIVGKVLMRENSGMGMFYHDAVNRKPLRWKRRLDGEEQDHTEPGD